MKDYILTKNPITYIKICYRHGIIARWIFTTKKLKHLDRYTLYTKYHVYVHDIYRYQKKNLFS